jgi:thiol-disulfide isomerase/thioredoxin
MNKKFIIGAIVIGIAFAGLGAYLGNKKFEPVPPKDGTVQKLMSMSLNDSQGTPQKLAQWNGKFLIVNFWATWCAPCVQEMPELVELQKELAKENVQILGLGIDSPSNIKDFANKLAISYPVFSTGMEGTDLAKAFGNKVGGLPFTVLISTDGRIVKTYAGRLKMEELKADVRLLNK